MRQVLARNACCCSTRSFFRTLPPAGLPNRQVGAGARRGRHPRDGAYRFGRLTPNCCCDCIGPGDYQPKPRNGQTHRLLREISSHHAPPRGGQPLRHAKTTSIVAKAVQEFLECRAKWQESLGQTSRTNGSTISSAIDRLANGRMVSRGGVFAYPLLCRGGPIFLQRVGCFKGWAMSSPSEDNRSILRDTQPDPEESLAEIPAAGQEFDREERGDAEEPRETTLPQPTDPDLFACPDCHVPLPEKYRILPKVVCPSCGQQTCHTGVHVTGTASPGQPPAIVKLQEIYWLPVPPGPGAGKPSGAPHEPGAIEQDDAINADGGRARAASTDNAVERLYRFGKHILQNAVSTPELREDQCADAHTQFIRA